MLKAYKQTQRQQFSDQF